MKAQFVYENMDFERGTDPKGSLRIGNVVKFAENFAEIVFDYDNQHSDGLIFTVSFEMSDERINLGPLHRSQHEGMPLADIIDINYSAPDLKQTFGEEDKEERYNYILSNSEKILKTTGLLKFLEEPPEILSSEDTVVSPDSYLSIDGEKANCARYQIKKDYQNIIPIGTEWKSKYRRNHLSEEFNFERGSDSGEYKRTLGIGKEALELEELENYAKYENEDPEDTKYRDVIYLENDYDTDSEELMDKILVAINGGKKIASGENVETDQSYQIWITDQGPIAVVDFDYGNSYFTTFRHKNNFRDEG